MEELTCGFQMMWFGLQSRLLGDLFFCLQVKKSKRRGWCQLAVKNFTKKPRLECALSMCRRDSKGPRRINTLNINNVLQTLAWRPSINNEGKVDFTVVRTLQLPERFIFYCDSHLWNSDCAREVRGAVSSLSFTIRHHRLKHRQDGKRFHWRRINTHSTFSSVYKKP